MAAGAVIAGMETFRRLGRTPGELLDYAERRLESHTRIEFVALPVISGLRRLFDAPSVAERAATPFFVPPPPARRGPKDVAEFSAPVGAARVWRVSPTGPIKTIAEAARLAKAGDVVEIEAGDYHQDVAVWEQSKLTIRGVNGAARLLADGRSAEGKAIWVFRRGDFEISNIDFIGARVEDGNGAGVRFEAGRLQVRHCLFWDNQMGLLTGGAESAADSTLVIDASEFGYSHVSDRWGHNLYVGTIASLTVTGSYFHHAGVGHLLKSRARVNDIRYNRLTDESGGRASYELEFPNGGQVRLVGNIVEQQRSSENSTLIAFGLEGYKWPLNALVMGSNTLVNEHPLGGTFLRVAPGSDGVLAANNLLVGPGTYQVTDRLKVFNDVYAGRDALAQPLRGDFRLTEWTSRLGYQPMPDAALRSQTAPGAQYVHPRQTVPLRDGPDYVGAVQQRKHLPERHP